MPCDENTFQREREKEEINIMPRGRPLSVILYNEPSIVGLQTKINSLISYSQLFFIKFVSVKMRRGRKLIFIQ